MIGGIKIVKVIHKNKINTQPKTKAGYIGMKDNLAYNYNNNKTIKRLSKLTVYFVA